MGRSRNDVEREVVAELVEYIDGDAENGPRYGVEVSDGDVQAEVDRRYQQELLDGYIEQEDARIFGDGPQI